MTFLSRLSPLLAALIVLSTDPQSAFSEVSSNLPGAIIVFPKVESTESTDTIIQLTNNTGSRVFARCFYIDGRSPVDSSEPSWLVTDFQTTLTRLQPTVWVAGSGLPAVPSDRPEELYPGPIPPVPAGFLGELRCIVVNESESPIGRNSLTGEATLVNRMTGAARKYQGVAFQGFTANDGNNTLLLDGSEYSSCPRLTFMNHFFDGAPDPVSSIPIQSNITIVPCSMDIENAVPGTAFVQFDVFNEFEQRLSRGLEVICFKDIQLSRIDNSSQPELSIFNYALQGTLVGLSRMRAAVDANSDHGHGILAIGEEWRDGSGSAMNLHTVGGNLQSDIVVLPDAF